MLCPTCKDVHLSMADRQGIEIDFCPNCRGVWLDRGELDRIIERTESAAVPPRPNVPPPPPRDRGYDQRGPEQGHYRHKRKKSILGELFDF